jgi:superfamily II DNA or RNA helicase
MRPKHPKVSKYEGLGLFRNRNSFAELDEAIGALPTEQERGEAFEVFVEAYFHIIRRHDFKKIWPIAVVPLNVLEALGIPVNDNGFDGVCQDFLGDFAPFQAKFRKNQRTLSWRDLATFYGLADSDRIGQTLVISNCADVRDIVKQRKNAVFILRDQLEQLGPEDFRQIEAWLQGARIERVKLQPRPDQLDAVKAINKALAELDRTKCLEACGTGKTYVALWTIQDLRPAKTIVFVPSLALLAQILDDWRGEWPFFDSLCVCSDETVDDDISVADCGFRVTTDPGLVRRFLDTFSDQPKIVFSTYQSSDVIQEAGGEFDLGIFDEAHKTAGRLGRNYSLGLDEQVISIKKRIFFTATPRHCEAAGGELGEEVYSMDDESVYGKVAYSLPVSEAIKLNVICPYKVIATVVTSLDVHAELRKRGVTDIKGDDVTTEQVANQIALRDVTEEYGVKKVFTFHSSVASAESFVRRGSEGISTHLKQDFDCRSIDGTMSVKKRKAILRSFKDSERAILSNMRVLSEGVNLPSVDCVAIFAPKKDRIGIAQIVGRASRKAAAKEFGYILVPIYMEPDEDMEGAARRSRFDAVIDVLQALREQGEPLSDLLRALVVRKVKGHHDNARVEREPAMPPLVPLDQLVEAIKIRCIDSLLGVFEKRWGENFQRTLRRKEEKGDCNVPYYEDASLHRWQVDQRVKNRRGDLDRNRWQRLDEIGFCWDVDEGQWSSNIQELDALRARTGSWAIPSNEKRMASFVARVRELNRENELPSHRRAQLEARGFPWEPKDAREERFRQTVEDLGNLFQKTGHRKISTEYKRFADTQRRLSKEGKLSAEHEAMLNEIQFPWDPQNEIWAEMFARFLELQRTGAEQTPRDKSWINNQRMDFKAGRMLPERAECLRKAGYDFEGNKKDEAWQKHYVEYCQHLRGTGDRFGHKASKPLRAWMRIQRREYRAMKLPEERVKLLETAGFLWEHPTTSYLHTHCKRGHEFTEENTGWDKRGTRRCLKCDALRARLKRANGDSEADKGQSVPTN